MNIRYSVILIAVAIMSVPALAKSNPQTTLSAPGVATVDGILTYCRRVDTGSAAAYTLALNNLTQGHSPDEVRDIRESKQYKDTLGNINSQLLKVPTAAGANACRAYLAGK